MDSLEEKEGLSNEKEDTKKSKTSKSARNRSKNRNGSTKSKSSHKKSAQVEEKEVDDVDISPFVSNPEGNVYAITNLPEEFIATLFAWVSRSPKSFKEHLKIALKDQNVVKEIQSFQELDEKAKKFHEKWTVGYGHSSVAEHAIAHVGIEKISRLASAELELSNSFYSITEYSQRYQRPKRGDWHNPFDLFVSHNGPTRDMKVNSLHDKFEAFMNQAFDTFEILIDRLQTYMKSSDQYKDYSDNAIEKLAFEDARYVLPLAMYTQLGMTANGRAWRDGIAKLGVSEYEEVRHLAIDLRTEISKVLPVLLKYAEPSQYQINSKKRIKSHFAGSFSVETWQPNARLIHLPSEEEAINVIIASWLLEHSRYSYKVALDYARSLDQETKNQIIADALHEMQFFDTPPDAFKNIHYKAEFLVSEANWHQLLRHNRKTDFTYNRPTPFFGVTIPPRIREAGLSDMVFEIGLESQHLYEEILRSDQPELADYVVLNAHKRRVVADFNLWEAYHLINLRTSEEAQWDIREAFEKLYSQLRQIHPNLIAQAQRR